MLSILFQALSCYFLWFDYNVIDIIFQFSELKCGDMDTERPGGQGLVLAVLLAALITFD